MPTALSALWAVSQLGPPHYAFCCPLCFCSCCPFILSDTQPHGCCPGFLRSSHRAWPPAPPLARQLRPPWQGPGVSRGLGAQGWAGEKPMGAMGWAGGQAWGQTGQVSAWPPGGGRCLLERPLETAFGEGRPQAPETRDRGSPPASGDPRFSLHALVPIPSVGAALSWSPATLHSPPLRHL